MKTEFMPLPDNDTKTINRAVDDIYRTLKDINDKFGSNIVDDSWLDEYVNTSSDTDKIDLIARFLGITKLEV